MKQHSERQMKPLKFLALALIVLTLCVFTATSFQMRPRSNLIGWRKLAPLNHGHSRHCLVQLGSDSVFVVGGFGRSGFATACEIYDPDKDTWSDNTTYPDINLPSFRFDGQVLVIDPGGPSEAVLYIGGYNDKLKPQNTVFKFTQKTMSWENVAPMNTARADFAAALLPDGRVLVAGGESDSNNTVTNTAEIYDPLSDRWLHGASMNTARTDEPELVRVFGGKMMVVGGSVILKRGGEKGTDPHVSLNTSEIYDPIRDTWAYTKNTMAEARRDHLVLPLPDRNGIVTKIMVVGGIVEDSRGADYYTFSFSSEMCEYVDGFWVWGKRRWFDDPERARILPGGAVLPNGNVLVFGGSAVGNVSREQFAKQLESKGFSPDAVAEKLSQLDSQGFERVGGPSTYVDLYDGVSHTWTSDVPQLHHGRWGPALNSTPAPVLSDGRILVAGGASETDVAQQSVEALITGASSVSPIRLLLLCAASVGWTGLFAWMIRRFGTAKAGRTL